MSEERLGQITLANAWNRIPPIIKDGRQGIQWPEKGVLLDPGKRIAKELEDALLREDEVDEDERDLAQAAKDAAELGLGDDAESTSDEEYAPQVELPPRNIAVRRGLRSDNSDWDIEAMLNGGQLPRKKEFRRNR